MVRDNYNGREVMDDIQMQYSGNRLSGISASGEGSMGFQAVGSGSLKPDDAGNITDDELRGVRITYNALSLPERIDAADGHVIKITYDAGGNKLSETILSPSGQVVSERKYYLGLEVVDGDFYQLQHSQGRYVYEIGSDPSYFEYVITDHLGNGRVWFADLNGDGEISTDPDDHEIRQEKHYYPFGLHMTHEEFWQDYPEGDRYQYNSIENIQLNNALLYAAYYRTLDAALGRWLQIDPAAEKFYQLSPYNAMGNSPFAINDPEGDEIISGILVGAAIGALVTGATTITVNLAVGNDWYQGLGRAMAFGAVSGGISAGVGGLFAGTTFGQSTSFGILNNLASTTATNLAFEQDITWGTLAGGVAGGFLRGQTIPYAGSAGGSFANGLREVAHMAHSGAFTGMIGGGIGALVDGKSVRRGMVNGLLHGALGGASQAALNIATMGTTYLPDQSYGDFGEFGPVYRRGNIITRTFMQGSGIALGRNLVTNQFNSRTAEKWGIDGPDYNNYLRAHETAHFAQQRELGFSGFYGKTALEYLKFGMRNVYGTPGTLEFQANRFAFDRLGYYYRSIYARRTSFQ